MDPVDGEATIDRDSYADLARSFSDTARILFSAGSVDGTLERVVDMAVTTIEGCDFAGLFVARRRGRLHAGLHRPDRGGHRRPAA